MSRKWESIVFETQEAEITLTPLSSLELGKKKIFDELGVHHV